MDSPPSFSTQSDMPLLSEDSGLLVTSESFSCDSVSDCQHADCITSELQESDYDEKSLSNDSTGFVDPMCGEYFNTVRKGPTKVAPTTIEPPVQFQDYPTADLVKIWVNSSSDISKIDKLNINTNDKLTVPTSMRKLSPIFTRNVKDGTLYDCRPSFNRKFSSSRLLHVSPCRSSRPASRNSFTSRLSSSHNSLVTQLQVDDSNFITQAISHDTLIADPTDICDIYNVPFDSDIYAMPVDMVRPMGKGKKKYRPVTKRKNESYNSTCHFAERSNISKDNVNFKESKLKRLHSVSAKSPVNYIESNKDSIHVTLREMKKYIHTLYSTSGDSDLIYVQKGSKSAINPKKKTQTEDIESSNKLYSKNHTNVKSCVEEANNNNKKHSMNLLNLNSKKSKSSYEKTDVINKCDKYVEKGHKSKVSPIRILSSNVKQSLCNLFRWRRYSVNEQCEVESGVDKLSLAPTKRALPPLPQAPPITPQDPAPADVSTDFATSIQKVKDYGWYWGPISVESAEKILSNEPDGSFIVRDSSDDHYIFTLTFKLNGLRHVRIEHDQGNFCFGGCTMFKAQTIVDFIENAVETSRSGRYLFFLNLRPMLGPVRVQLLYPVSRFKRVQSLQHMCRFIILKYVRRDLVNSLPLPRRLLDYLCATHYYSELLAEM